MKREHMFTKQLKINLIDGSQAVAAPYEYS